MKKSIFGYLFLFFGLFFIQVFALNNIHISGLINPFVYPFAILLLPMLMNKSVRLVLAFGFGLLFDFFSLTGGLHAFSLTAMTFFMAFWSQIIFAKSQYADDSQVLLKDAELPKFLLFCGGNLFVHHLLLFSIEAASFGEIGQVVLKSILSLLASLAFVLVIKLVFLPPSKR